MICIEGVIVKAISGFFYVDSDEKIYQCRARGIFKKNKITPMVGDRVQIKILQSDDIDEGWIEKIYPRSTELIRPAVANVEQAVIVFALKHPDPHINLLDKLIVMGYYNKNGRVTPNKIDLKHKDKSQIISYYSREIKQMEEERRNGAIIEKDEDNYQYGISNRNRFINPVHKHLEKYMILGKWKSVSIGNKLKGTVYDKNISLEIVDDKRYYMVMTSSEKSYPKDKANGYWEIKRDFKSKKKYLSLDQFVPEENLSKAFFSITNYGRTLKLLIAQDNRIEDGGVGFDADFENKDSLKPYIIKFERIPSK